MIVTEEDAKTKRCQESYAAAGGLSVDGHIEAVPMPPDAISFTPQLTFQRQNAPAYCIGSDCMAWRWVREREWMPNREFGHIAEEKIGFCGKAGKP